MLSFREYVNINEQFKNYFTADTEKKSAIADTIFAMIQKAYADQGGIHGSGFKNPEDMIKNIPFWKVASKDGKVTAVALYKDKSGRKRVSIATDGSDHGKKAIGDIVTSDLKQQRAHMEISGKSLSFLKKQMNLIDHLQSFAEAKKFHDSNGDMINHPPSDDPEVVRHPELKPYFYQRDIGGELHTKVMLGTLGKSIK